MLQSKQPFMSFFRPPPPDSDEEPLERGTEHAVIPVPAPAGVADPFAAYERDTRPSGHGLRRLRRVGWELLQTLALAALIFFTRLVDLFWLITPAFFPQGVHIHWLDLVILIAIGGGWMAVFAWLWAGKSPEDALAAIMLETQGQA